MIQQQSLSYDMYMYPQRDNIPLQALDKCALTVGATSGPHCQTGVLHWHHFTSHGFTWSAKSTLEKQTSRPTCIPQNRVIKCTWLHFITYTLLSAQGIVDFWYYLLSACIVIMAGSYLILTLHITSNFASKRKSYTSQLASYGNQYIVTTVISS